MTTPVTTFAAIRDRMVTTIKALTPTRAASDKFIYAPRQVELGAFREYAEQNDSAVLRWYVIDRLGTERLGVCDLDVELRLVHAQLVVAYPRHYGTYGADNSAELEDVVEEDLSQIAAAVGYRGAVSYLAGQHAAVEGQVQLEQGEGVVFGVVPIDITYYSDAG